MSVIIVLYQHYMIKISLPQAVFEVNYCPSTTPLNFELVLELQAGKEVAFINEIFKQPNTIF